MAAPWLFEDLHFRKVVTFLEEKNISSHSYLEKTQNVAPTILNKRYERICDDYKVVANFTEYLDTGGLFLNNAWIEFIK